MKGLGGGFLGLGNTFRAFVPVTPIRDAVNLAHRMARRRLEKGGATTPSPKPTSRKTIPVDFILPLDLNGEEVQKAIEAKLAGASPQRVDVPPVIERRAGARVVVPAHHLLRLGDGNFARGKQFMHGIVKLIRARRMRQK